MLDVYLTLAYKSSWDIGYPRLEKSIPQYFYLSRLSFGSIWEVFSFITAQNTLALGTKGRVKFSPRKMTKTFVFKFYNLTENASHVPI